MRVTLPSWWLGRTLAEPTYITKASTGTNWIKNTISDTDVNVIVPAVVVPCGLLVIGAIVLVIFCVRHKARKNVGERPDGTSIQDKGNTIDGWKQSLGQGKVTDNLDTVYTTPDGFITHPGGAAISTTRSYKDNKYQNCQDVSRSHRDHNGRKQQRDYYSQYEMADYGGNGAGHRHTKQDTAFYY
ncbi:hypothetical protein ACJMK2_007064 [Sinanodonta woodiana]|uniref:Uncharacterized protein n=1 Tax=Sinanodonta woodiana TaxID=1069815 RepID=A0ABD3VHL9_SINWO